MELSPLTAVSPVDGRYHSKTEALADYFSEYAVIRYRVLIEIEYFIALSQAGLPQLPPVGRRHAGIAPPHLRPPRCSHLPKPPR